MKRSFYNQHEAVAGVIEALLLVGLIAVIISTIQLVYIPEIMFQREAEHMDQIENQFSYIKSVIDLQSTVKENVPISSPLTLGSRELPYFVTARSFGQLDILDSGSSEIDTDFVTDVPLTSIMYEAMNSYYVDQTYVLEGGCLIINQTEGESVQVEPSIQYENRTDEIRISYLLPRYLSIAGKNSTGGIKNCYIRTNYSSEVQYAGSTSYIKIYTKYLDAWNHTLNKMFEELVKPGYININSYKTANPSYVGITPGSKDLYLDMTVVSIKAQIGPGTVL